MDDTTIIEAREELMVSPSSDENKILRTSYFIKPCIKNSPQHDFLPPHFSISSKTITKLPLELKYNGWRPPQEEWKQWVKKLQPKFESLWIETGIYHAIKASTYEIKRDDELILELANKWCSKTNTFVFPWGESTITLEDTNVCFGYSLLGCSVSTPLVNSEQKKVEDELFEARRMFNSSKAKKVTQRAWMMYFMENESKVEHEAFLVYWLSRFVFPGDSFEIIVKSVFSIAIHLAYGNRVALAPSVLASIYRDLSLLNSIITIENATTIKNLRGTLWAPFQLVQIWALERFKALKPHTYAIGHGLPKVARWDGEKVKKNENLKKVLDGAGFKNGFLWKPYENSPCIEVYNEKDMWKCDNPCLDEEMLTFARCLRVCELVGMGCKEKYFPHRVAMQFGMDQDIPGEVVLCKKDPWMSYSKQVAFVDLDLCIKLCSRQPDVTSRYYDWWKQSKSSEEGNNSIKVEESYGLTPCFTSKFKKNQMEGSDKEDHLLVYELSSSDEVDQNGKDLSSAELGDFTSSNVGDKDDHLVLYVLSSSDDKVVENAEVLSSAEFGDFTSSNVGDEDETKSLFWDRNGEKGESDTPFTLDMTIDLENRIKKLERLVPKLKEARFGKKG